MVTTLSNPLIFLIISGAAFLLMLITTPSIIQIASYHRLYNFNLRKKHPDLKVSRLAGIAVLVALMLPLFITLQSDFLKSLNFFMGSCLILFFAGLKDDLLSLHPLSKFAVLLIAALITIVFGDIKITSLQGFFNIYTLPEPLSILLTVIVILFIVNAFSLLDVVYGLVGLTGLSVNGTLGILFIHINQPVLALIAFSIAGSCLGFLQFNLVLKKIFLGEGGCLLLGFVSSVLCIEFLKLNDQFVSETLMFSPAVVVAVLIFPIYNALRLFAVAKLNAIFKLNINTASIAHQLSSLGLSYGRTAIVLSSFNILAVILVVSSGQLNGRLMCGILLLLCIICDCVISYAAEIKWERSVDEKKRKLQVIYRRFMF